MTRKVLTLLSVLAVALGGCALNPLKLWPQKDKQALPNQGPAHARNVILFIGEGMGVSTVTAARTLAGRSGDPPKSEKGRPNVEEKELAFEHFPATALAKTYNTDLQNPGSAGAMSAILTGVNTRGSSLALDPVPSKGQCAEAAHHETATLLEQARAVGLSTGLVTTARVTYAAAAATYAHLSDPDWEVDAVIPETPTREGCRDIARQLADQRGPDVVLGGGRLAFLPNTRTDPYDDGRRGVRRGAADLVAVWLKTNNGRYLTNASQLKNVNWKVDKAPILGLFAPDHMHYEADRLTAGTDEPSLTEMTEAAITALQRNPKGYVLVVDAAGIGRAHRDGHADNALSETWELSRAVKKAAELAGGLTLIVVTAEHGDTLTIGGGEDVPVYARGPGSQRVRGSLDQPALYWIMRAALLGQPPTPKKTGLP